MLIIRITADFAGWSVRLHSDDWRFREGIEALKSHVPSYLRGFDRSAKCWFIDSAAEVHLWAWRRFAERDLDAKIIDDDDEPDPAESRRRQQHRPPREDAVAAAYKDLFLIPGAPIQLVKAAHKILARQFHPDFGGNHETMIRVNTAFDRIVGRERAA